MADTPKLTAFQRDIIREIAAHVRQHGRPPKGLAIKSRLEDEYCQTINHGRLYPNLDELVEYGLVEKSERDRRTNNYRLTEDGDHEAVRLYGGWAHALGVNDDVDGGDA